jgi:sugar lactone lactonase YvrE
MRETLDPFTLSKGYAVTLCRSGCIAGLILLGACRQPKEPARTGVAAQPIVLRDRGFATPESVLHDPLTDVYFVSNINGSPLAADDNGFISLLAPDGELMALKAIDGAADSVTLNAPKGMAVAGDFLYVADLTTLRRFDRRTLGPRGEIPIPGATFLNDVAAGDDGSVYFTDSGLKAGPNGFVASGTDAIYRLTPAGKLDTLARGDDLGRPNGIAVSGDSVWVVSFGSGELYRIAGGRKTDVVKLPKGSLDGLILLNGTAIVSSWDGQALFRGHPGGSFAAILSPVPAPADIGFDADRYRLLVPLFEKNEVWIVTLLP